MPKTYTRLTEEERYQIYGGVTEKWSHREIAALIAKHHSTVSREVKRNTGLRSYRPKQAQERDQNKPRHRKLTSDVQSLIAENIKYEWSPDQVRADLEARDSLWSALPLSAALSSEIKPQSVIFTSTFTIEIPTKGARARQMLEAKLSGACQSTRDRPLLMRKYA
jgi:hypothetical protein